MSSKDIMTEQKEQQPQQKLKLLDISGIPANTSTEEQDILLFFGVFISMSCERGAHSPDFTGCGAVISAPFTSGPP